MATNYNSNPNATSNLTGWTKYGGGTLASTSEGALWKPTAGSYTTNKIRVALQSSAGTGSYCLAGFKIRRNTSASGQPVQVALYGDLTYGFAVGLFGYELTDLPVGQWVTFPRSPNTGRYDTTSWYLEIMGDGSGKAMDLTITAVYVYETGDVPTPLLVKNSDALFTVTQNDNSLAATVKHAYGASPLAVSKLTWTWGDSSASVIGAGAGYRLVANGQKYVKANPVTHTFPARGRYTVGLTAENYDTVNESPGTLSGNPSSGSSTQIVTVPMGPFTADFNSEINYLALNVDGAPSVSPTLDPIDLYTWNWGDGSTSTGKQQSHTYAQPGSYAVALTISTTATQRSHTTTKTVVATAPVDPANYFVVSEKLLQAAFTPSIQDGSSYAWTFGDGSTSTDKNAVHTYDAPGTYSVTLTVNGTLTTTQSVTVVEAYTALRIPDALRLEVAVPPAAGVIYNRLKNPDGVQGSYGWVTPLTGSTLIGSSTSDGPKDKAVPGAKLIYTSSGSGTQVLYSVPAIVTAGQYVGAQFVCTYVDGYYRAVVEALDASGAIVGTSAQTGYLSALGTAQRTTAYLLPAGSVAARVRINHYSNTSAGTPAAGKILQLRHVMLATAPASATLTTLPYADNENFQNVLGSTVSISTSRDELNVGTFSALIADSTYDPAVSGVIRPGQTVRLRAAVPDSSGNIVWENVYYGTLSNATVDYVDKVNVTAKSTRITLTATDAITRLSQTNEPRGVALISELPELLESAGIPFEVNGSSGQVPASNIVSYNENASTADQVAITRDTSGGYAYVNRNGVLIASDPSHMSTVAVGAIDEESYSGINATFNTDKCMNSVTIKWLSDTDGADGVSSRENIWGPYEDSASIATWGFHPATFTMQGVENSATIAAKAAAILAANATPVQHINSVTIPIRNVEDLTPSKALIDLYDLVQLGFERISLDQNVRVTGISHQITATQWLMKIDFAVDGAVASPQFTPSPPTVVTTPAIPFASRRKVSAQSIANTTTTVIDLDTVNVQEGITWDATNKAYVVVTAGLYQISGSIQYNAQTTAAFGRGECSIYVNTTQIVNAQGLFVTTTPLQPIGSFTSCTRRLSVGDAVSLRTYQTTGAAQAIRTGAAFTYLEMVRLGD